MQSNLVVFVLVGGLGVVGGARARVARSFRARTTHKALGMLLLRCLSTVYSLSAGGGAVKKGFRGAFQGRWARSPAAGLCKQELEGASSSFFPWPPQIGRVRELLP